MKEIKSPPLSIYHDVTPLCKKGHIMLVQNEEDGQLYVKKHIHSYNPQLYVQLKKSPVPNTPTIYEIYARDIAPSPAGTELIIIEEYLPGCTLAEHLTEQGLFSEKEAIDIALQLCRILMDLHKLNPPIIHRDIKPSNVMLLPDGTVKLLDFNAAKAEHSTQRRDTVLLGTAGFAAPEQYGFSSSTPQTDIYAMGVLLNLMITGAMPWEKTADGRLKRIIHRCLRLNPKERYAGTWELYSVLKRASVVRAEWLPPGFRTLRIHKMLVALPAYLFVILISLGPDAEKFDSPAEYNIMRLTFFLLGIAPILFYGNYMDIRRFFPFMTSPNRRLRLLGLILAPFVLALIVLAFSVALHIIWA